MHDGNREATATIRGYIYQFDATIAEVLRLNNDAILTVEGIEDFDVVRGNMTDLFQCKYYAAQRLTNSTLRDAILPMLQGFLTLGEAGRRNRHHHLYGYFKDSPTGDKKLTLDELKSCLVRRQQTKLPTGGIKSEKLDLQLAMGASDPDLESFAESLTIHVCGEYEGHKQSVIQELKNVSNVSFHEAEEFLYPSALTFISELATRIDPTERQLSKAHFLQRVRPSYALYNAWTLREKGKAAYCRSIRQKYFSMRNVDPVHRFFVIEVPGEATDVEILNVLYSLRCKWSSHAVQRKPDRERYSPLVHLRGLSAERLAQLKTTLLEQGMKFVDGHAFLGATFSIEHLCAPQTYANQISLRFVNETADFITSINSLKGRRCLYQFYVDSPMVLTATCEHVAIPITSIAMITEIV